MAQNKTLSAILLISILGLVVYANSLLGEFVWDDIYLVKNNQLIQTWTNLPQIFAKDIGSGASISYYFYRPLQIFTYMLDYSCWDLNTIGYHLTNIILHILAALCIYWLITILFSDRRLSLLTALFFVVHPIHTEAVTYISGRTDPLGSLFVLLAFIFYIKYNQKQTIGSYLAVILCYLLSLLSRENSLILPLLLLLCYHFVLKKRVNWLLLAPQFILAFIYIGLRLTILKHTTILGNEPPPTLLLERLPGIFRALTNYCKMLFFPYPLHMEHGMQTYSFAQPRIIIGILLFVFLFFLAWKYRNSFQLITFSIIWFFTALLPVSNLYPINAYMAEHWLYLPSLGFFLLLAKGLSSCYRRVRWRDPAMILTVFLITFFSLLTIRQNTTWKNPLTFFEYTRRYAPTSWRVQDNLGIIYSKEERHEEAIDAFTKAVYHNSDHIDGYYNLGNELKKTGKLEDAAQFYFMTLEKDPDFIEAYVNLGNIYNKTGNSQEAIKNYQQALQLDPESVEALFNLGNAYISERNAPAAISTFHKVIELDPEYTAAYNNLGNLYKITGEYDAAVSFFQQALAVDPSYSKTYYNLGNLYSDYGKKKEAIDSLRKAVEIDPEYTMACYKLSRLYFEKGNYKQAIEYADRAAELGYINPPYLMQLKPHRVDTD